MTTAIDPRAFVLANTRIHPVPHAPEIRLHLADEAVALWQKTEDDLGAIGLPPPFWAFAWAGGQALARHILDEPSLVAGRSVYDFATGSGLVAIAAARSGAARVTACDIDRFALAAAGLNMELNEVSFALEGEDPLSLAPPDAEVILTGDVFYEKPMADRVLAWADQALARGSRVLVGDPGRAYLPRERIRHLATFDVPVNRSLEDFEVKRSSVYELLPPAS
ncbi:class I SAM-dependent methyltransferase [Stappia indica]|uniref:Predicted nicotinamide N-methyase n=1 Tax=Stappia indica TaxID=538381 RepID=A0A285RZ74_9HYPH|nr:methyltransferase [Stappia indica]SOB99882.1 Predicted nicotinamide N-methyase [Stappia indica]